MADNKSRSQITKDKYTIKEHQLQTADGVHELYVQEWGNPKGIVIFYLHGGPGGGCSDNNKLAFDPEKHRVIFLDQRGSGNSTPYGSLKNNTTENLVEDIELVRGKLQLGPMHIMGRSWGSTLALCYAVKYPENVKSMIIGGIFLGTEEEINWVESGQLEKFYPEIWEKNKGKELDSFTYAQIIIPALRLDDRLAPIDKEEFDPSPLEIELHYSKNRNFIEDGYILKSAPKITAPVCMVQGRYDMVCPPISAYKLHKALPNSKLYMNVAGHSGSDRGNYDVMKVLLSQLK